MPAGLFRTKLLDALAQPQDSFWVIWDYGKENGNYCSILGIYRDNGKENGNYYRV